MKKNFNLKSIISMLFDDNNIVNKVLIWLFRVSKYSISFFIIYVMLKYNLSFNSLETQFIYDFIINDDISNKKWINELNQIETQISENEEMGILNTVFGVFNKSILFFC